MNDIQLQNIDLNLLAVLDVLLRERSVTRTAERIHVTPSAVSHALKRLRELLGDELLIRDGRKMRLTVRAQGLAETLPRVLAQIARIMDGPDPFVPETSTRTFRLAAPDFVAALVPALLNRVWHAAPSVRIEIAPYTPTAAHELAEGRNDALVSPGALSNEGLRALELGTWSWGVYGRAGHPAFTDWSLAAWAASHHLQVRTSVLRGRGPVDQRADELGVHREIRASVPQFSMAAPILSETHMLLTVPSITMEGTASAYRLERRELPFELPPLRLSLFRSAAEGDEPGVRWFLGQVAAVFQTLKER